MKMFLAALALLTATASSAETVTHCEAIAKNRGMEVTHDVTFSGTPRGIGFWEVPFSVIEVRFADEASQSWLLDTVTYKIQLMHWLENALKQHVLGEPIIAVRHENGQIFLMVQQTSGDGQPGCISTPLEMW